MELFITENPNNLSVNLPNPIDCKTVKVTEAALPPVAITLQNASLLYKNTEGEMQVHDGHYSKLNLLNQFNSLLPSDKYKFTLNNDLISVECKEGAELVLSNSLVNVLHLPKQMTSGSYTSENIPMILIIQCNFVTERMHNNSYKPILCFLKPLVSTTKVSCNVNKISQLKIWVTDEYDNPVRFLPGNAYFHLQFESL